jgi:hypothetical protein
MIWQDLLMPLRDAGLDLSRATLIHGGGWKKLVDQAVSKSEFKASMRSSLPAVS